MAADLEAEVQAIDKSLLECSAEEIAVVRRRARRGEGAGARRPREAPACEPLPGPRRGRSAGRASSPGPGVPAGAGSEGTPAGSAVPLWPQRAVVAGVAVAAAEIHGSDQPAFPVVPAGAGGCLEAAGTWPSPAGGGRASRPFLSCFPKLLSSSSAALSPLSLGNHA